MTFLAPYNLMWWGLVAVPVVLFYLVRLGGRRQDVSTYLLWQRAFARRSAWSRWWQTWVSLAVALAFVALLVVALARPFWTADRERARSVVLVLDTSASMNATDVGPSRLARAKIYARQIIDRLEPDEQIALVSAGGQIDVQCGFTRDRRRIAAALDSVRASEGPTRVVDATALARRMTAGQANPQIVVLTDGAFADAEQLAAAEDLHLVAVAGDSNNTGITRLAARNSAGKRSVFVEVTNFGSQPVDCRLNVRFMGDADEDSTVAAAETMTFAIPAGGAVTQTVPLAVGAAGLVVAQLDQDDSLAADNRAQLLVPAWHSPHVLFVGSEASPVAAALQAMHGISVEVTDRLPADVDARTVVVLSGRVPAQLPPGPTLVLEPDALIDFWELDETNDEARRVIGPVFHASSNSATSSRTQSLLAGLDLTRVVFEEKVPLKLADGFVPLVEDQTDLPLLAVIDRPDDLGPVVLLTTRLAQSKSDLTLRREFPLLLANAVRWLAGSEPAVYQPTATSEVVQLPPSSQPRELRSPDGPSIRLAADQTFAGPLPRGGVWTVGTDRGVTPESAGGAEPEAAIAVSLTDPVESNIRPRVAATEAVPPELLRGGPRTPLWIWLVVLAGIVSLLEWFLYHRRVLV